MKLIKLLFSVLFILGNVFSVSAHLPMGNINQNPQSGGNAKLPNTELGRRLQALITVFNTGDEKAVRDFIASNYQEDGLKEHPVEERARVWSQLQSNLAPLSIQKVLEITDSSITVLTRTGKGEWVSFGMLCGPSAPHKILGLRIDEAEPPDQPDQPKLTEAEALASIEGLINDLVKKDEFSGVVLVAKDGKPIFEKAYGLASKEYNVPNRVDTKFNIGSINKIVTQVAIQQLVEQEKLTLDDHIDKFLPDYPNHDAAAKITIRQLLTMTSGIGDFFGPEYNNTPKDQIRTLKDYLTLFGSKPLLFEPGTKAQYSNGGYIVLGLIIEKLSGMSYFDYVREHVFRPVGMDHTDYYEADMPIENMASGYTKSDGNGGQLKTRRNNIYTRPARGSSAGGGYSTVEDLLKFANALHERKLNLPDFSRPPASAKQENPGMPTPGGADGLGVAGGAPGLNAEIDSGVAGHYSVVVVANYDPPTATSAGQSIRKLLLRITK